MELRRHVSIWFSIACLTISLAVHARAHENCGTARDAVVDAARNGVLKLIPFAKQEAADAKTKSTSYTTWMGAYDSKREAYVQKQLKGADKLMKSAAFKTKCGTSVDKNCVAGMSAYVDVAVSRNDVTLCDVFFTETGNVQRGMILHEVIHLLISQPGDSHAEMTSDDARQLAASAPDDAIKSAYNYQYWFE